MNTHLLHITPLLQLLQQRPDGSFHDVSMSSQLTFTGIPGGIAAGDIDNDGLIDLCITGYTVTAGSIFSSPTSTTTNCRISSSQISMANPTPSASIRPAASRNFLPHGPCTAPAEAVTSQPANKPCISDWAPAHKSIRSPLTGPMAPAKSSQAAVPTKS